MKITTVRSRMEHFELARPYTIAFRTTSSVESGIVEIHTADGRIGYGAGSPEPFVTGETFAACAEALAVEALDWLVGRDVRELAALTRMLASRLEKTPAARAAIDMALYDLFAKHLELPLVSVLGRAHHALPTSITIGIKSLEETLTEANEYLARGFKVLKVKLGHDLEEDLERLEALRASIGAGVTVRVDPNQGYDAKDVLAFLERTDKLGIEFLEQPMPANDIAAMRALPAAARARLAADETLLSERDALALVAPPAACGIFNIKLMKCGGITAARRIADIAELSATELMWGCMDESKIGIAAALHTALASPATRYLDLDGSLDLARDVAEGGFVIEDGMMRTTDEPGLGVRCP